MRGKIHWLCIYDWDRTHDLLLTRQALPLDYLSKIQIVCFKHSAMHPFRATVHL